MDNILSGLSGCMALKNGGLLPAFPPPLLPVRRDGAATEVRFSRWNNANAEPFQRRRREQEEIEFDLRLLRRHNSASNIAADADVVEPSTPSSFHSHGSPSSPSSPSIPARNSKYSKNPRNSRNSTPSHPAFCRISRASGRARTPPSSDAGSGVSVGEKGIAYKIDGAPFEFQYSYTETPKVRPLALREPPFMPFGPSTMPRPWTGRAPLPASKKKLPEFDSFRLPPPGKKGVKPVQSPGPFLEGSGPKYKAATRDEILGDPLTAEEIKELVKGSLKTRRQMNMGRDGLTHNMLDNIHAHWKRRRVCKIKCKGVCTVDMDNVNQQLEEKTGGKIIYSRGGVIFLFRGRNYNYRTRPRFPLMLWKPVTPVYPRLVQQAPEDLTLEEASELRKRGRQLPPICKLGKNGLYSNLVKNVKEAFEECELVRVDCTGMNRSDCRKIGAKLRDLVPCVLLSFEFEHILMWRGKDWKSSLPLQEDCHTDAEESMANGQTTTLATTSSWPVNLPETPEVGAGSSLNENKVSPRTTILVQDLSEENHSPSNLAKTDQPVTLLNSDTYKMPMGAVNASVHVHQAAPVSDARKSADEDYCLAMPHLIDGSDSDKFPDPVESQLSTAIEASPNRLATSGVLNITIDIGTTDDAGTKLAESLENHNADFAATKSSKLEEQSTLSMPEGETWLLGISYVSPVSLGDNNGRTSEAKIIPTESLQHQNAAEASEKCLDAVKLLLGQAVDSGSAVILDKDFLDANIVFERSVALAKTAPRGPIFSHRIRKTVVKRIGKRESKEHREENLEAEAATISENRGNTKRTSRNIKMEDFREGFTDALPHGSLRVDELAKLLA